MSLKAPSGFALQPEEYASNPGYLKLDLMLRGLRVGASALAASDSLCEVVSDFGSTGDLDLVLPDDTWASVPVRPEFTGRSPYTLEREDGAFSIRHGDTSVPVHWQPPGAFYEARTQSGVPFSSIGVIHGRHLALAPNRDCSFIGTHTECKFCSAVLTTATDNRPRSIDDVLETVAFAKEHQGPIRMVYLAMGHTATEDHGVAALEDYVVAIKRHHDILVGVDVLPPATNDWIDRTYAMGVDAVSYNLEVWDPARFAEVCPGLDRHVGRDRFLSALEYAAGVFPRGAVACHLIVGQDDPTATIEGIDWLTERGVVPVLPLFRPFKGVDMRTDVGDLPRVEDVAKVYAYLYESLRQHKIPMTWVRDMSVVTTPIEGRFFLGEEAKLAGFVRRLMDSAVGRRTAVTLSDLRRALRVRRVSDQ